MKTYRNGAERRTTIRKRLFTLTLVSAFLPILLYGAVNLVSYINIITHTAHERLQKIGMRAGKETEMYVLHTFEIINTLVESISGAMLTPQQLDVIVKNYTVNFPQLRDIMVEWNGRKFRSLGEIPERVRMYSVGNGRSISSLVFDRITAIPIIYVATTLRDPMSGDIKVVASLSLMNLWKRIRTLEEDTGLTFILLDQNFNVIAYSKSDKKAQAIVFAKRGVQRLAESLIKTPYSIIREPDGTYSMGIYVPLRDIRWGVIATFPLFKGFSQSALGIARIIAIILSSLLFIYLVSSYHAGFIAGAVSQLEKATREVRQENFHYRVKIKTRDELEDLADAFNLMNERIERLIEEIKEKERRLTFVRLIRGLLHDLKHPFRGIKSVLSSADFGRWGHLIQQYVRDAEEFLDDLHTLSREQIDLPLSGVSSRKVIEDVIEVYRPYAEKRNINLEARYTEDIHVRASEHHLKRVLSNIVENALNATDEAGHVTVILRDADAEKAVIEVVDNGCGISQENLKRVFEWEFSTSSRGLGLGLPLSKVLVEAMGGRIEITSSSGEGTQVRIYLLKEDKIGRKT